MMNLRPNTFLVITKYGKPGYIYGDSEDILDSLAGVLSIMLNKIQLSWTGSGKLKSIQLG